MEQPGNPEPHPDPATDPSPVTRRERSRRLLDAARFGRSWRALGARHARAFEVLVTCYAEPQRAYHDAEHVAECTAWLDRVRALARRPDELEIAIYFHDAVYAPGAPDNETRSAALLRALASDAGIEAPAIARIAALIESTAQHGCEDGEGALLRDIDLSILGASPARYARYEAAIRAEHAAAGEPAYRAGRAAFLRAMLERTAIFATRCFAARLEAQARDNLGRALRQLQAP